jgi:hypothetical protein
MVAVGTEKRVSGRDRGVHISVSVPEWFEFIVRRYVKIRYIDGDASIGNIPYVCK